MSDEAHWSYILVAYGATVAVLGAAIYRVVREHRRLTAELREIEKHSGGET